MEQQVFRRSFLKASMCENIWPRTNRTKRKRLNLRRQRLRSVSTFHWNSYLFPRISVKQSLNVSNKIHFEHNKASRTTFIRLLARFFQRSFFWLVYLQACCKMSGFLLHTFYSMMKFKSCFIDSLVWVVARVKTLFTNQFSNNIVSFRLQKGRKK